MNDFEDEIRRTLRSGASSPIDADDFLQGVHRGVRRRRARRTVAVAAAAVTLVATGGVVVNQVGVFDTKGDHVDSATQPEPTSSTQRTNANTLAGIDIGFSPLSLTATGTMHQWVLGTTGCPSPDCLFIKKTTDGGSSWSDEQVPPAPVGTGNTTAKTVTQLRAQGHGGPNQWAYGGALWSTHDGGITWKRPSLPSPGQVVALEAWGSDVYAGVKVSDNAYYVASSPTGRDDWQRVKTGTTFTSINSIGVSVNGPAIAGADANYGAAIATRTADGSWQRSSGCRGGLSAKLSAAPDSLWMLCRTGSLAQAYVSTDQGIAFRPAPGQFGWDAEIAARTQNSGVIAGPGAGGVRTLHANAKPMRIRIAGLRFNQSFVFAGFTNLETGYLISIDGGLFKTADGGKTWTRIRLPH